MRLVYLDIARAYAILLVTTHHLWRFFAQPSKEFYIYDAYSIFEKGWGGVELFFIISGYSMALITYKGKDSHTQLQWSKYILKRLYRIIPAYYIAIFIWTILIYNGVAVKPIGWFDQIAHLLFIHTLFPETFYSISGVFWSIAIEMQFYFVLPFILVFIIRFPILSILVALLPLLYSEFISDVQAFFLVFVYFVLGYVIYIYKDYIYKTLFSSQHKTKVLLFFTLLYLHLLFLKTSILTPNIHTLLLTIAIIPLFIYASKSNTLQCSKNYLLKIFTFTGTVSYSIYLYNYIFYIDKKPFSYSIEALIFYFLLIYITGIAMYFIVEKPFQKLRKELTYK